MGNKIKLLLYIPDDNELLKFEEFLNTRPEIKFLSAGNFSQLEDQLKTFSPDGFITSEDSSELSSLNDTSNDFEGTFKVKLYKENFAFDPYFNDHLNLPASDDDLMMMLHSIKIHTELKNEIHDKKNKIDHLQNEIESSNELNVNIAFKLLTTKIPFYYDILIKTARACENIAPYFKELSPLDLQNTIAAAKLSQIGRLLLPDEIKNKPATKDGYTVNDSHLRLLPQLSKELLSGLDNFQNASKYIYHVYENLDGSGVPDNLQAWQIPLPSRIIRVALDYYELGNEEKNKDLILERMKKLTGRIYDKRILPLFEEYILSNDEAAAHSEEIPVLLFDLKEGMTLSRDITSASGLKLMSKSAILDQKKITFLLSHNTADPILGKIFVKKDPALI